MADIDGIRRDLRAEHDALDDVVAGLDESGWDTATPAPGWSVRDQISHLTFFDEEATLAASDPDAFLVRLTEAANDIDGYMNGCLEKGRAMRPAEVLEWWRGSRGRMLDVFGDVDPSVRVPWYGPPMSLASFITARLMETWAHGQDVVDAVGIEREATERMRHIVFIGVRARQNSYVAHGMEMPAGDVRVELKSPDGDTWSFGSSDEDVVTGSAEDFCLVVTQRRHPEDTDLVVTGPLAEEWISIAQAFAGPPGEGRKPGQFPRS
jgi:uncharacterized protein (TIGR03084 family)